MTRSFPPVVAEQLRAAHGRFEEAVGERALLIDVYPVGIRALVSLGLRDVAGDSERRRNVARRAARIAPRLAGRGR